MTIDGPNSDSPVAGQIGKVEIPWQAGVFVFVEDDGTLQVRHGVEDQRSDPVRLPHYQAIELAYLLLWGAERKSWTVVSDKDTVRLRLAFRQVIEASDRDLREAVERVAEMYKDPSA